MLDEPTMIAGRYAVLRHLGSGGMGSVFLARDEVLKREVAIKRVHAGAGTDAARRIRREAKIGAGLTHPALVTVFDTTVEDANLIIVMEYVEGETLAERLRRGRLAPDETLEVLRPVAAALDHAHAHGIVHRDVKPANVLLGERGAVKLADLGLALSDDVSRITRDGALIGSLPYMAPEQLEPGSATSAVDVYALAAIAYEALSGRRAREGRTPVELVRAAATDPVPDLSAVAPDRPPAAAKVLAAAMARDPLARPPSAGMLIDELATALAAAPARTPAPAAAPAPEPIVESPPTPRVVAQPVRATATPPRRRGALLGLLALVAVAAALAVVLIGGGEDASVPDRAETSDSAATATATADAAAPIAPPDTAPADPVAAADTSTPTGAVRAFYELAAQDDFDGAWALAGPEMRAAFGDSQERFAADLGSLESIRFKVLEAGAEASGGTLVTVETVARHTDRTDRCAGDLLAVPDGSGGFLVDPAGVSCTSS